MYVTVVLYKKMYFIQHKMETYMKLILTLKGAMCKKTKNKNKKKLEITLQSVRGIGLIMI